MKFPCFVVSAHAPWDFDSSQKAGFAPELRKEGSASVAHRPGSQLAHPFIAFFNEEII